MFILNREYAHNNDGNLYDRFMNLAINRFKWSNLPYGITSRIMERNLCNYGQVFFFKDADGVYKCYPAFGVGGMNPYYEPTQYNVVGYGVSEVINADNGVIIRNNAQGKNDAHDLMVFAQRIAEIEAKMDINLQQQAVPWIITGDEKERLTIKNLLKQIQDNKFIIFGRKSMTMEKLNVLQTNTPYLLDKLQTHKNALMNELLTFLGINNSNVEKRERLLVDEVNANNDFILVNLDHMLEERVVAVGEINDRYGLNIKVERRSVEDVEIHNRVTESDREQLSDI